jgi:hypothetical protein
MMTPVIGHCIWRQASTETFGRFVCFFGLFCLAAEKFGNKFTKVVDEVGKEWSSRGELCLVGHCVSPLLLFADDPNLPACRYSNVVLDCFFLHCLR